MSSSPPKKIEKMLVECGVEPPSELSGRLDLVGTVLADPRSPLRGVHTAKIRELEGIMSFAIALNAKPGISAIGCLISTHCAPEYTC